MSGTTLYDKIWDAHMVEADSDGNSLLYIDRHLVHEVTSPQAFEGLRMAGRSRARRIKLWPWPITIFRRQTALAVDAIDDPESKLQIETLEKIAPSSALIICRWMIFARALSMLPARAGLYLARPDHCVRRQPYLHTWCLWRFGAWYWHSEVEHVLATQTSFNQKPKTSALMWSASPAHVTAKDIALAIIGEIGTAGGTGYVLEYAGEAIEALSMEGRMTLCNMSIEAARAPDWWRRMKKHLLS